jgi:trk system potassium uptake protein
MNVIVVGGGKTGAQLTLRLLDGGHQVKVVESRPHAVENLLEELPEDAVVLGDGSSPAVLEDAGVLKAQVLAAVTGDDEANLVIMTLARFEYNVPRTIARVNNPRNAWLYTREMGVDAALNETEILAGLIEEEMAAGEPATLLKLRRGLYSLVEVKIPPEGRAVGAPLESILLPETCVIAVVIRSGRVIVPRGSLVFEAGDEIMAIVDEQARKTLQELLA